MTVSVEEEWAGLVAENRRMRAALEEIARTTFSAEINQLAHQGLGHQRKPATEQMLAELRWERR